jgi:uncharacterized protein YjdB
LGVATTQGTVAVSYLQKSTEIQDAMKALTIGSYVTFTGVVTVSNSGDISQSKYVLVNAAPTLVVSPSWEFDGFLTAKTVDMKDGFKEFGNQLVQNDLGVMYTFTNVEFATIGNSSLSSTNYDYLNYDSAELVSGKNDIDAGSSATDYFRIGVYKYPLDTNGFNTTSKYSINAFLVGANNVVPFVGGNNVILRLSGYVEMVSSQPILPTAITISAVGNAVSLIETTTLQLSLTFAPLNASKSIAWTSSNEDIATVSSAGLVTGIVPGQVIIKAISNVDLLIEDTISLEVTAKVQVESITITSLGDVTSLASNGQLQLSATINPINAFDKSITWSLKNSQMENYATITTNPNDNSKAVVTGKAVGSIVVVAQSQMTTAVVGELPLEVEEPIILTALTVTATSNEIMVGETLQLTISPTPSEYAGTYTYSIPSEDEGKATVSNTGLVTAGENTGIVTITVQSVEYPSVFNELALTIYKLTEVESINFENGFTTGTGYQSTVTAGPTNKTWEFYYGTPSTNTPITGLISGQMRWYLSSVNNIGYGKMNYDVSNVTYVTFNASSFYNTTGSSGAIGMSLKVEYSINLGTNWIGNQTYVLTASPQNYKFNIPNEHQASPLRLKFTLAFGTQPTANSKVVFDDVKLIKRD